MNHPDCHEKFMQEALKDARRAFDHHEFPVGCVLVYQNRVIARGQRIHSTGRGMVELDHAEVMALRNLESTGLEVEMARVTAYATLEPCLMCYATLLLNGIRHIVYAYEDAMGGGTGLALGQLKPLYQSMSVKLVPHVMRSESLALLKAFFSNPDNDYWQNSLLARYTLEQP